MKTARLLVMLTGCLYPPGEIKDTTIIKLLKGTPFIFLMGMRVKWRWWGNESEVTWRWWGNESEVRWRWWGNESEVTWRWLGNYAVHLPLARLPTPLITDKNSDECPS